MTESADGQMHPLRLYHNSRFSSRENSGKKRVRRDLTRTILSASISENGHGYAKREKQPLERASESLRHIREFPTLETPTTESHERVREGPDWAPKIHERAF